MRERERERMKKKRGERKEGRKGGREGGREWEAKSIRGRGEENRSTFYSLLDQIIVS